MKLKSPYKLNEPPQEIVRFFPEIKFHPIWIATKGDRDKKTSLKTLEKTNFFTDEIDQRQAAGEFRISIHAAKDLPRFPFDKSQMKDVLLNLLRNAVEASPQESVVDIQVTKEVRALAISVSDNGAGIPQELREKIFVPFFTTKSQGTGLGLPTVSRVAEAHGGTVGVESGAGGGTTFILKFPLPHG